MKMNKRSFLLLTPLATTIYNLMLAYVVYFLARVLYLVLNYSYFTVDMTYGHLLQLFLGGLVFDTSAILVTNIPYIVLGMGRRRASISRSVNGCTSASTGWHCSSTSAMRSISASRCAAPRPPSSASSPMRATWVPSSSRRW